MDNWIYIIVIFGVVVLVLLVFSLLQPLISAKLKAKKFGIKLDWEEAKALSNFYTLTEEFMENAKELLDMHPGVSVIPLADFYRGGGSFKTLKQDFQIALDSDKNIGVSTVILLNLGKKDIKESIEKIDRTYELKISSIQENDLEVDYEMEFKVEYEQAFWLDPDLKKLKEMVDSRVKLALSNSELKEEQDQSAYILKNYLNRDFWRWATCAVILNEKLEVRAINI